MDDHTIHRWIAAAAAELMPQAARLRDAGHARLVSFSKKVFIPLTRLCRDLCGYCTFAHAPRPGEPAYLSPEEVLAIARAGRAAGCHEALFTLGDKPELRYRAAREALAALGHESTIAYLAAMCELVRRETGLIPHVNPGVMTAADIARLRRVSASQGLMLESVARRLCARGGPHYGSPDKTPAARLETLRLAGEARVPFTTGILVGIGETRAERIEALLAIRDLHERYGHVQEVIVQNFRAKPGTRMAGAPDCAREEHLWSIAAARLVLGADMNIQAPPNLSGAGCADLIDAGINDWGGVSPVTPDHVNPEAPWPALAELERVTATRGKFLIERLPSYPSYCLEARRWHDAHIATAIVRASDSEGYARADEWSPGLPVPLNLQQRGARGEREGSDDLPEGARSPRTLSGARGEREGSDDLPEGARSPRTLSGARGEREGSDDLPEGARSLRSIPIAPPADLIGIVSRAQAGAGLEESEIVRLFLARGAEFDFVCAAADGLRRAAAGELVRYVVNRNINYTNICSYRCTFCAFSKGTHARALRGEPYELPLTEIGRRVAEAWARGATEVCMQGGIHPSFDGETYLGILRAAKAAAPAIHVHAFTPLEVTHGAATLGLTVRAFLRELIAAGLGSLPGTAAEILDDEVRRVICPDKVNTGEWLSVMQTAHELGLRTTSTIMFGHLEQPRHWARHLMRLRELQQRTGGFTEFVPLPFVHMEAPVYRRGDARKGPTSREAVLMHAVARLALNPLIPNIQVSWVKMGEAGARACLAAGANDLGGTLMNESISRAAGALHGQEFSPAAMDGLIRAAGRVPVQRTTLYAAAPAAQSQRSYGAPPLLEPAPAAGNRAAARRVPDSAPATGDRRA